MRKELYKAIRDKLRGIGDGAIKHIDMWNHNVEFLEQETAWERPAVFVEFVPIRWRALVDGQEYRAEPEIRLHIVTDWNGGDDDADLDVFDLLEDIHRALAHLDGERFLCLDLVQSDTNHNHEELLENIETYNCVALKNLYE